MLPPDDRRQAPAPTDPPSPVSPEPAAVADADPGASPQTASAIPGWRLFWQVALGVVVLDQMTKQLVQLWLPALASKTIIPGLLNLTHVHNQGVAFGLLNNSSLPYQGALTAALAMLALAGIVYYARHVQPEEWLARIGLSLILGGAVGNLLDRLWLGYVVDFVDVYWGTWHFWAFNLADAGISVGAVLVFADLLVVSRHASRPV